MLNGRIPLHIFERCIITSQQYCEEVILDHVHLLKDAASPNFLFMNDNMRPNRTVEVSYILESKNTERMEWLTDSSDLIL